MNRDEDEDLTIYKVVLNHEEQYSIWPADRDNPLGWRDGGFTGLKHDCLSHIEDVWTDMRPLSLRRTMEQNARDVNHTMQTFTHVQHEGSMRHMPASEDRAPRAAADATPSQP